MAVSWLNAHGKRFDRLRVDLITVTKLPLGQSNCEHIRGVG
jgi:hypothetical protein